MVLSNPLLSIKTISGYSPFLAFLNTNHEAKVVKLAMLATDSFAELRMEGPISGENSTKLLLNFFKVSWILNVGLNWLWWSEFYEIASKPFHGRLNSKNSLWSLFMVSWIPHGKLNPKKLLQSLFMVGSIQNGGLYSKKCLWNLFVVSKILKGRLNSKKLLWNLFMVGKVLNGGQNSKKLLWNLFLMGWILNGGLNSKPFNGVPISECRADY